MTKPKTNRTKHRATSTHAPIAPTRRSDEPKRYGRDRLSNGKVLVEAQDKRSAAFRRWKFLYEQQRDRTGPEADQLARQYATAVVRREQLDTAVVDGTPVDPVALTRLCSLIMRLERKLEAMVIDPNAERDRREREREDLEAGLV